MTVDGVNRKVHNTGCNKENAVACSARMLQCEIEVQRGKNEKSDSAESAKITEGSTNIRAVEHIHTAADTGKQTPEIHRKQLILLMWRLADACTPPDPIVAKDSERKMMTMAPES